MMAILLFYNLRHQLFSLQLKNPNWLNLLAPLWWIVANFSCDIYLQGAEYWLLLLYWVYFTEKLKHVFSKEYF